MTERDWVKSARHAPAWTTNKQASNREDLFLALDTMWQIGIEHDLHLDSKFVAARTRARSLAATLIPKSPKSPKSTTPKFYCSECNRTFFNKGWHAEACGSPDIHEL